MDGLTDPQPHNAFEMITREKLSALEARMTEALEDLKTQMVSLQRTLEKLQNRPTVWAALVMTGQGWVIGALMATVVALLTK
ncbi:hypothetical protein [Candidatus Nitrospira bockiana]